jgi:transposase-like protein
MRKVEAPEIDPTDVLETSQSFLCKACGTELTVKLQSVVANEPPKHCKEEMTPIEN